MINDSEIKNANLDEQVTKIFQEKFLDITKVNFKGKTDWVFLKLSIPKELREYLDFYKKLSNISYSKYILETIKENVKMKTIILKLNNNQILSPEELIYVESLVQID